MTRIFIFRVETEGFYTTLVIIPGNITIEIATERYEGERRRFCQRQAFCVCASEYRERYAVPLFPFRFDSRRSSFLRQKKKVEAAPKSWLTSFIS